MTQVLSLRGVSRSYQSVAVVSDANLDILPGEITALLGGSGAGKSTLLRLLAGLEPVDAGEIRLGTHCLSKPGMTVPAERRHIGLIFQDFALFPHLTVVRNVAFGLKHLGRALAEAKAMKWLEQVNLADRAEAFPHELSGGEQQRVAIARALAPEPAAILMDEPFSGLDPTLRSGVRDLALSAIRAAGVPALLVTHDPAEALESADTIAIMQGGRLLQVGAARDVYLAPNQPAVAAALGPINRMDAAKLPAGLLNDPVPRDAVVIVRPEGIVIDPASPVKATLKAVRLTGPLQRLVLELNGAEWVAYAPRQADFTGQAQVGIRLDKELAFIFPSA